MNALLRALAPTLPIVMIMLFFAAFLSINGCAAPTPREVTVIKEVPVPYHQPCPKPADKPTPPKRVAEEHPTMPTDPVEVTRILAAKILEWISYGERADGVMTACSE